MEHQSHNQESVRTTAKSTNKKRNRAYARETPTRMMNAGLAVIGDKIWSVDTTVCGVDFDPVSAPTSIFPDPMRDGRIDIA